MFTKVQLKNFLSLVDLDVNFEKKKGIPKSLLLIYGENGAGKTHFVQAFRALQLSLSSLPQGRSIEMMPEKMEIDESVSNDMVAVLSKELKNQFVPVSRLAEIYQTAGTAEPVVMEFDFVLNGYAGTYTLAFDKSGLIHEKLRYALSQRVVTCFEISGEDIRINKNIFLDRELLKRARSIQEDCIGKYSFLSILLYLGSDLSEAAFKNKVNANLIQVLEYFHSLCIMVEDSPALRGSACVPKSELAMHLSAGEIHISQEKELDEQEEMLNRLLASLNPDIRGVFYKREREAEKVHYQLWFKKDIYGCVREIDYQKESSGTRQLLQIFPFLILAVQGETVILDEFDIDVHDFLMQQLMQNLEPHITGQLILTTHNTSLMETDLPKDSFYILDIDSERRKEMIPVTDFERIYPSLNLRSRYLAGLYGGGPFSANPDFSAVSDRYEPESK